MKKHIPNFITMLNLFSGCVAVVMAVWGELELAALFVFIGIFFDFFDGLAARKLGVQSELGIQLDSLADMVTSGLVPGIVMFQLLSITSGWSSGVNHTVGWEWSPSHDLSNYVPFLGFLITLASAYRLAKFNIDEDQVTSFIGLPTPANALLIVSLPLILFYQGNDAYNEIITNKWFLIGLTLISCYLLNARIPLFALKFKNFGFKGNETRYIFLLLCIVLLIVLKFAAIPLIIVMYVGMSVLNNIAEKRRTNS